MDELHNIVQINPCTSAEYGAKVERPSYSVLSKDKIVKALKLKLPSWQQSLEKFISFLIHSLKSPNAR